MKYIKLTDYKDYRVFLRDYYEIRKTQDHKFSYRMFALKADINSSGLYSNLVSGAKNLTVNTATKFSKALELSEREFEYFLLMLSWTHSQDSEHKVSIEEEMSRFWPKSARRYREAQKDFFSSGLHSTILQSLHVFELKENYQEMAEFLIPSVAIGEVKESIELLTELEMVKRDENGVLRSTHPTGIGGKEVGVQVIRDFQKSFMAKGQEALNLFSPDERHVVSNTLSASSASISKIKEKIHKLQKEIQEIVQSEDGADQVYQLNFQFFPLSQKK